MGHSAAELRVARQCLPRVRARADAHERVVVLVLVLDLDKHAVAADHLADFFVRHTSAKVAESADGLLGHHASLQVADAVVGVAHQRIVLLLQ